MNTHTEQANDTQSNARTNGQNNNAQGTDFCSYLPYQIYEKSTNLPGSFRLTEERTHELMNQSRNAIGELSKINPVIDTPILLKTVLPFAKSRSEELYLMFAFGREEMKMKIQQDQAIPDFLTEMLFGFPGGRR